MKASSVLPWACPNCKLALRNVPGADSGLMACAKCNGRALSLSLVSKVSKPALVAELWHMAKAQNRLVGKPCPGCRKRTLQVTAAPSLGSVVLDICDTCHVVWFDDGELARVPKSTVQPTAPDSYDDELLGTRGYHPGHYDGFDLLYLVERIVRLFRH